MLKYAEGFLPSLGYALGPVQVSASFAELCNIVPPKHFLVPFGHAVYGIMSMYRLFAWHRLKIIV